jgi:RHS repeat-associated protein
VTNQYLYSAAGEKLQVKQGTAATTDYVGNKIYENGSLKRILVDGGYIEYNGTTPTYYFYIQDHLGNNRMVANASGAVVQTNHYYPFGATFAENSGASTNPYKYNGKELDAKNGLNWLDYGARHYDPVIGRWGVLDPKAEKYYSVSPYVYALNNPIYLIDKDGREPGPGDLFRTQQEAATDWGKYYNGTSILRGREFGSTIYVINVDGERRYSYSVAAEGGKDGVVESPAPNGRHGVSIVHSHGQYSTEWINEHGDGNNQFSLDPDIKIYNKRKIDGYVATPNGSLLRYNFEKRRVDKEPVTTQLPSDPKDPSRKNNIAPTDVPKEQYQQFQEGMNRIVDFFKGIFD